MSEKREIWFLEGSTAEELVAPLRRSYDLRSLGANKQSDASVTPVAEGAANYGVVLADMREGGPVLPASWNGSGSNYRVIGVVPATGLGSAKTSESHGAKAAASVFAFVSSSASIEELEKTLGIAFENLELRARERAAREELESAEREREQLNEIGIALSSQRDIRELLNLILAKAREITRADAGSLYLMEDEGEGEDGRNLRFMLTQNDSLVFPFKEFALPMAEDSMAGYSALRGEVLNFADAYNIPPEMPFRFNDHYDRESGYRTKSLLTLPMRNAKGEVLGVLQLINAKNDPAARLRNEADVAQHVRPFRERSVRLALSLASQAAVAYENRKLYNDIQTLFEGFVKAAVTAIEQRDPTTSGHSLRVAAYTQGLAEIVDQVSTGPYSGSHFDHEQMKEIRYAALLHDFGKVGVREEVLVKAKKLYPLQMELVKQRFDYIRKEVEVGMVRRKLQMFLERDRGDALSEIARLSEDYEQRLERIQDYLRFILEANEPTLMEQGQFRKLSEIAHQFFEDSKGSELPYINADEVRLLSIPKGSLDASERQQIESHVVYTFNFLSQIPWTKELRGVPEIARAHHEKLNGLGYPYKLHGDQIPLPTKMMTICDIFDALTASDRPYKRAVPVERALSILEECVRANEIDAELYRLFCESKVYERLMAPPPPK
ncbi:MAG: HD domain-containing phosphohydrolase [Candidatus Acidiferrales bacterium]|jgi:HD-GYP domain-containing protein (c-di-GMP phosphodiesterase class II)